MYQPSTTDTSKFFRLAEETSHCVLTKHTSCFYLLRTYPMAYSPGTQSEINKFYSHHSQSVSSETRGEGFRAGLRHWVELRPSPKSMFES